MIKNKERMIKKAEGLGFSYERDYKGCAQCTIMAVSEVLGINNPLLIKAASGLAGGGGKMCDGDCGGYSGGIMMMSSIFGRREDMMDKDDPEKNVSNVMAQKLREVFISRYGSVICGEIHNRIFGRTYNMNDEADIQEFEKDGAHTDKCTSVVGNAAGAVTELILDEADRRKMSIEELREAGSL
jgi:C_GCAxxG_C_C family probable redox protein